MCWQGCGGKGTPVHWWRECKLVQPLWKKLWRYLKNLKIDQPYFNQSLSWVYTQRNATLVTPESSAHPCLLQHYSQ
jgi:hypothetical protein